MKHPRTAALTGGIASGKSTVARMFQECGAVLFDADLLARQVVEPEQPAWREIVAHFGQTILLENGQINRTQLGALVFQHPEERAILERIIHPRVIAELNQREQTIRATDEKQIVLVDVPLLIEASMHTEYASVIVVYVPEAIQLQRVMARDQLSEQAARQRIASQMPLSEKTHYATHIIYNDETLDRTRQQVINIYHDLLNFI